MDQPLTAGESGRHPVLFPIRVSDLEDAADLAQTAALTRFGGLAHDCHEQAGMMRGPVREDVRASPHRATEGRQAGDRHVRRVGLSLPLDQGEHLPHQAVPGSRAERGPLSNEPGLTY